MAIKSTNSNKDKTLSVNEKEHLKKELVLEQALTLLRECSEAKNVDEALKIITDKACVLVGGKGGSVWLRSGEDRNKIILRWTYRPEGANKIGKSFYTNIMDSDGYYDGLTGWIFATGKPLCLTDISDINEIGKYPHLKWIDKYGGFNQAQDREKQKHFMAVPIFSCRIKKEVIGVLRIGSSQTIEPFDVKQLELLQTYSGYISGLLTNYIKREEERILIERLFTVASQSDLETLLEEASKTIPIVIDGSYCSIFLKNKEGDFCLEATSAPHLLKFTRKNAQETCLKYKEGSGKTGRVGSTGVSIRVHGNITSEAGMKADLCECGTTSAAFLASAIKERNSSPVGVIRVVRSLDFGEKFDEDDEQFLESFGEKLYRCLNIHGYFTKGTCFVIMPFGKELDDLYHTILKPTVERFDFVCKREDEYSSIGVLSTGIISHIASANFIIAEITENNPNVYYELGIAHTLEKVVILLSQSSAPSDIRHYKYINYKNTAGDAMKLIDNLSTAIKELISSRTISKSSQKVN